MINRVADEKMCMRILSQYISHSHIIIRLSMWSGLHACKIEKSKKNQNYKSKPFHERHKSHRVRYRSSDPSTSSNCRNGHQDIVLCFLTTILTTIYFWSYVIFSSLLLISSTWTFKLNFLKLLEQVLKLC